MSIKYKIYNNLNSSNNNNSSIIITNKTNKWSTEIVSEWVSKWQFHTRCLEFSHNTRNFCRWKTLSCQVSPCKLNTFVSISNTFIAVYYLKFKWASRVSHRLSVHRMSCVHMSVNSFIQSYKALRIIIGWMDGWWVGWYVTLGIYFVIYFERILFIKRVLRIVMSTNLFLNKIYSSVVFLLLHKLSVCQGKISKITEERFHD